MVDRYYEPNSTISDDFREQNIKFTLSKHEDDLYNEEDDKIYKVIRVKRVGMPARGEKWKIFNDMELIATIEGHKLTKKEKIFLRSIDGINFLIWQFKTGIKSFNAIKKAIRAQIKPKTRKKRS
jgi:hypothetical protein